MYFSPEEGPVYFSGKIMSKSCKKGTKSSRKRRFLEISCKRKLLEQLLKIEISDVFEKIEKWVLRRPERSLFESKKLCHEDWIQSWNYVLQNYVFRSEEWLVSFHDNNTRKFSLFEKNNNFFWVLRDLRVQEGLQCQPNSPFCGISSSDSGSGKSLPRVPKSSKSRGGH